MKDHTEYLLDALFEEYKQLSTSFDKHVGVIVLGFRHYYVLLEIFVIVILIPASMRSWWTMVEWGFSTYLRVVFVAIPPALIIIVRLTMRYVDRAAIARINALGDSLA